MDKPRYAEFLITKLLPSIDEKWPRKLEVLGRMIEQTVMIQQDNARAHLTPQEFAYLTRNIKIPGIKVVLMYQPSNSPDLNVLDLALFWSLEREYNKKKSKSLDQLHKHLTETYWSYPMHKI